MEEEKDSKRSIHGGLGDPRRCSCWRLKREDPSLSSKRSPKEEISRKVKQKEEKDELGTFYSTKKLVLLLFHLLGKSTLSSIT